MRTFRRFSLRGDRPVRRALLAMAPYVPPVAGLAVMDATTAGMIPPAGIGAYAGWMVALWTYKVGSKFAAGTLGERVDDSGGAAGFSPSVGAGTCFLCGLMISGMLGMPAGTSVALIGSSAIGAVIIHRGTRAGQDVKSDDILIDGEGVEVVISPTTVSIDVSRIRRARVDHALGPNWKEFKMSENAVSITRPAPRRKTRDHGQDEEPTLS